VSGFALDPRLDADGLFVTDLPLCHVRLARDARWPWLVAVPRRAGAEEIVDLSPADRAVLVEELAQLSDALRSVAGADKLNVAALGNVVRQLHVHVVARRTGDDGWPGPIWGRPEPQGHAAGVAEAMAAAVRARLGG